MSRGPALSPYLLMTSFSTIELSTTTICSGILTSTETRPREKRVRAATQCPPGPSKENATMSLGESLLSCSLKEKLSGWSNLPAAQTLLKNWNDSVQMVVGNLHVKILHRHKAGKGFLRTGCRRPSADGLCTLQTTAVTSTPAPLPPPM